MGLVWSIVNNLQLITHLPLLKLIYPANAEYVLNFLIDITNFEMIPADDILKKIFKFLDAIKTNINNDEEVFNGYSIDDFIENTA